MQRLNTAWNWIDRNLLKADIGRTTGSIWLLTAMQAATVAAVVGLALRPHAEGGFDGLLVAVAGMAGVGCSVLLCLMLTMMLKHLYRKPLATVDLLFRELAEGRVDLSQDIDRLPYRELRHVHAGYNRLMAQVRDLIETIRNMGIRIAIDSTSARKTVDETVEKTRQQKSLSEMVSLSSNDANTAINELSQTAQYVSDNTTTNLANARQAFSELIHVTDKIEQIVGTVTTFRDTVDELIRNSAGIMDIVGLINNISEETGLLSLNATIEAARAGEHGKGFAVVAEEVRTLAKRVKPATEDIAAKVRTMIATVEKTKAETDAIMQLSEAVGETVNQTSKQFESMTGDLEGTNEQLLKVAAAIEELTVNNGEIHGKVGDIDRLAHEIDAHMDASAGSLRGLNEITEKMQEMVSQYKTGRGMLDRIIAQARHHRDALQARIEAMNKQGVNVFDRNYRPVPNTNPQKYTTAYTEAFKKAFQRYIDDILKEIPGAIYALPVDEKGYLATHHSHVSQPVTGDHEKDLLYSRDRRIYYNNPTEVRRVTSTAPMLLQTYMRDTGEILNDLAMPIVIEGRHWGAFLLGLNPDKVLASAK